MTREEEIRKRLEGDEAGVSVHMVAFDREVRADVRYLLEKVERLTADCEHWFALYSVLTDEEKAAAHARNEAKNRQD